MSQFFQINPHNPQPRLIKKATAIIRGGGVIVYPTDSAYALGCHLDDKKAVDRLRLIRQVDAKHNFTLVCRDLSEIATYAKLNNTVYRILKAFTPGSYTYILKATLEVPRRLQHLKRRTIGLRVPGNPIAHALLEELDEPLMSTTLILPGEEIPMTDPYEIRELLEHQVELVIDGGHCGIAPTTVVDLTGDAAVVTRIGKGDPRVFQA